MQALIAAIKDPATGNVAMWPIVVLMLMHQANIRKLFTRQDDQAERLSHLEGEHSAAHKLNNCPMKGAAEVVSHCPLLPEAKVAENVENAAGCNIAP